MLVLSRQIDEDIVIPLPDGRHIVVKVTDIRSDKVRLGFAAPPDIKVYRREVYEEIQQEALAARQLPPAAPVRPTLLRRVRTVDRPVARD